MPARGIPQTAPGTGRRRLASALALVVAAAIVVAGCGGGTLDRHALSVRAGDVRSLAAEGALLAGHAASGDTTGTYLHEQSSALRSAAESAATGLAHAEAERGLTARGRRLAALARRVAGDLRRLPGAPDAAQRALGRDLQEAARRSGAIEESLR